MEREALNYLIKRTANLAIGNSTLRNQGASGLNKIARDFLCTIDLQHLSSEKDKFSENLANLTEKLRLKFPKGANNFGAARKSINIYLRDCLYNKYINEEFSLDHIASILELPLDSHVAKGLELTKHKPKLPKWDAIKRLKESENMLYQKYAGLVAGELRCNRVDLDVYLWRKIGIGALKNI
ncbi:hypothetical protein [Microbulbifer sp. SAOS-129_SWC]|uniref:hypothetical protein n=1 Tax=Microbulbifer sp. SAOS-129_SWC TaxID=3145235 RepID=UPI0032180A53